MSVIVGVIEINVQNNYALSFDASACSYEVVQGSMCVCSYVEQSHGFEFQTIVFHVAPTLQLPNAG